MQNQAAEAMPLYRVYLYNPRLWMLVGFLVMVVGHTTRCGDAYR